MPNALDLKHHLGQVKDLPKLYETEQIPTDKKIVHAHLFTGPLDVYVTEYDPKEQVVFGLTGIAGVSHELEWGEQYVPEMIECGLEFDLYWKPITAGEARQKWNARMGL